MWSWPLQRLLGPCGAILGARERDAEKARRHLARYSDGGRRADRLRQPHRGEETHPQRPTPARAEAHHGGHRQERHRGLRGLRVARLGGWIVNGLKGPRR